MSTERLDNNTGTVRIEENNGTIRLDNGESTVRLDKPDISAGIVISQLKQDAQNIQQTILGESGGRKTGEVFNSGQVIELNMDNYTVESIICMSSGEAVIYKVNRDGKPYVLKYYKPGYPQPDEIPVWKSVLSAIKDNPQSKIVKLYSFGNHFGQYFEIMEYAEGGTLNDYLKENGPIKDSAHFKNIVEQIDEGLKQLHNKLRIIYQDLKPENIYFRDKEKTSIILADFGISSIMDPNEDVAEVTVNATREYAAPELARKLNETKKIVGPQIDFFALGVTMLHIWLGTKPFQDEKPTKIDRQIETKSIKFPEDMPLDCKTLIGGLLDHSPVLRWESQYIKKWLAGESLESDRITSISYEQQMFNETESYKTPLELAMLLEKDTERGITLLYGGVISSWLNKAGDHFNLTKIDDIVSSITDDNKKKDGLYAVIYILNPDKPFISNGKKECKTDPEIAAALMEESNHYMNALKNSDDFFYLYLQATGGNDGKLFAREFHRYFNDYSSKRALSLIYLLLQDDDGRSIAIGSKTYQEPDEISAETDATQMDLIKKAVQEEDSLLLVWLANHYDGFFNSTEEFISLPVEDKFFLLGKFPFLSYKELTPDWEKHAVSDLIGLIHGNPGRSDLFEIYAAQGLPFNGQAEELDWRPTPIGYLAAFFTTIITNTDTNTGFELIRYLQKHGADINAYSGDDTLPLLNALQQRNISLAKLLLELGADPNKPNKDGLTPIMAVGFWIHGVEDENKNDEARIELANLLLDYHVDVNVPYNDRTPLLTMLEIKPCKEKVDLVSRFVSAGSIVDAENTDGLTPLMIAVYIGTETKNPSEKAYAKEIIEILLKKGAKTEKLQKTGCWSPLMQCAAVNDCEIAALLLKYGAKKDFADVDGNTAFVYAKQQKNIEVAQLLDPGKVLAGKASLFAAGKVLLKIFAVLGVFLTMDVLSRVVSSFNFTYPVLLGTSILLSHLLSAYILIVIFGFRDYLMVLRGSFNFILSACFYIFGIPVIFPLLVVGLQALSKLLPDGVLVALSFPAELLTRSSFGIVIFLCYLISLAIMMGAVIFFSRFTYKFDKVMRTYKQFS